jgi:hypothetical protein
VAYLGLCKWHLRPLLNKLLNIQYVEEASLNTVVGFSFDEAGKRVAYQLMESGFATLSSENIKTTKALYSFRLILYFFLHLVLSNVRLTVLRSRSRSRKKLHNFGGAGAATRCGFDSKADVQHG